MRLTTEQHAILSAASAKSATPLRAIAEDESIDHNAAAGAAFALEELGLLAIEEQTAVTFTLTEEGARYLDEGLPELRLFNAVSDSDEAVDLGAAIEAANLDSDSIDIAISNLTRKGYGRVEGGTISVVDDQTSDEDEEAAALASIANGEKPTTAIVDQLERRGLVDRTESVSRSVTLTDDGVDALMAGIEIAENAGAVRPGHLVDGSWQDLTYAEYDVEADTAPIIAGKRHVLRMVADRVKDVLVGMGFREMQGPHVDADFWINDCLFMPQDHPARTHWDRFELAEPTEIESLPSDLVDRVKRAHLEGVGTDGEGYRSPWDEQFARALALRGHTTSLTTRYLSGTAIGDLEPPQRFFSVEKVYRNDTLDPTHLLEFFQIEGWVMAEALSVRDLMGTFEEFYARFGIYDLEFKPHYNPYTEPSFELFGTHPKTGELIEIGNSGIFRDEMLRPLGIEHDVMAWGLALERLAMLITGEADIRNVHGTLVDLAFLRDAEVIY